MTRNAAALLLTRGQGSEREVFLVERSPQLRFFGGYWALPGGVRDPGDGEDVAGDDRPALRRCAVRELFEETGVLLAPSGLAGERRAETRARLLAGAAGSAAEFAALGLADAAPGTLRDVCRILTPPFALARYDTLFVHAELPRGEVPSIEPGELVAGRFFSPAAALAAWRRDELRLVPPLVILLELLVEHATLAAFAAAAETLAASYRAGALHRVRFSPGVLLLPLRTPTLPPATTTNCYVLGTRSLWIVDPGSPDAGEQTRLFALVDQLVAEGATVAGILVTHHHRDHVGGVSATSRRYDAEVRGHPLTLERLPEGFRAGAPLLDGDRIDLGTAPDGTPGWFVEAVFTPGHDRGHLCFRESRYDAMLVGDMLSTISTIVIDPPEGHLQTYLTSLERLERERLTTLYPAHGPAVRDGQNLVRHYLRHRGQREQKLLTALDEGPCTEQELLPKVYWDVDRTLFPIAARSLAAGLAKLAEEGRARVDPTGRWHRVD